MEIWDFNYKEQSGSNRKRNVVFNHAKHFFRILISTPDVLVECYLLEEKFKLKCKFSGNHEEQFSKKLNGSAIGIPVLVNEFANHTSRPKWMV